MEVARKTEIVNQWDVEAVSEWDGEGWSRHG